MSRGGACCNGLRISGGSSRTATRGVRGGSAVPVVLPGRRGVRGGRAEPVRLPGEEVDLASAPPTSPPMRSQSGSTSCPAAPEPESSGERRRCRARRPTSWRSSWRSARRCRRTRLPSCTGTSTCSPPTRTGSARGSARPSSLPSPRRAHPRACLCTSRPNRVERRVLRPPRLHSALRVGPPARRPAHVGDGPSARSAPLTALDEHVLQHAAPVGHQPVDAEFEQADHLGPSSIVHTCTTTWWRWATRRFAASPR